uniref:Nose resistant to fluoxetine protein 6 n=1 Tax=Aceria tosichella TaxID=561515 RepID=A0A6G1SB00_9ACAR
MIRANKLIIRAAEPLIVVTLIVFAAITFIEASTKTGHYEQPVATAKQNRSSLLLRSGPYTGEEWHEILSCPGNETSSRTTFRVPLSNIWYALTNRCNKDSNAWRYKYIDELKPAFNHLISDSTIDERLANLINTIYINIFDTDFFTFNWGDPVKDAENELRVAGPQVNDTQCLKELNIMWELYDDMLATLARLKQANETTRSSNQSLRLQGRHVRLARVLDSFGRYESGSLDGKVFLGGSYYECIGSQLLATTTRNMDNDKRHDQEHPADTKIQMRYCWARMDINRHLHPILKNRKKFDYEQASPMLHVATCLPSSCHSKSLHHNASQAIVQRLINSQLHLPSSIYVNEALQLESVFCLVDGDSDWGRISASGKLCLLFIGFWLLLCLGATIIANNNNSSSSSSSKEHNHCLQPRSRDDGYHEVLADNNNDNNFSKPQRASLLTRVCKCLDLKQSWHDLTSDKRRLDPTDPLDLDVLNPMKILSCLFCIMSHVGLTLGAISSNTIQIFASVDTGKFSMGALGTSGVVDGFFVISGMLVTYISLIKLTRNQRLNPVQSVVIAPPVSHSDHHHRQTTLPWAIEPRKSSKQQTNLRHTKLFFSKWFVLFIHRYLRIVPLYALIFWFRRDVLTYLFDGPLWDYGLNHDTPNGACLKEPWYIPFTFVSAFRPMSRQCFLPSWSISNDIFYAMFTPPIILWLVSKPRSALIATISLTIITSLASMDALANLPPASVWEILEMNYQGIVLLFRDLGPIYTWPFYRIPAFLIGTLSGYYLFRYEQNYSMTRQQQQQQQSQQQTCSLELEHQSGSATTDTKAAVYSSSPPNGGWPRWFTGPATQLSYFFFIFHTIMATYGNDMKGPYWPLMRFSIFFNITLDRVIWSLASAVVFLQMMTNWRHNSLMQNFSGQKWRTLAKIQFAVIFVHWMLIIVYTGLMPAPPTFTLWHMFMGSTTITFAAYAISAVIHVVFENPMDKLIKREIFKL